MHSLVQTLPLCHDCAESKEDASEEHASEGGSAGGAASDHDRDRDRRRHACVPRAGTYHARLGHVSDVAEEKEEEGKGKAKAENGKG